MSEIRIASTVILLRDGEDGLEVFMVRRHINSDFVGGAHVFPGGAVDPVDAIDETLCVGRTDASASAALGIQSGGLAYWIAAIRECFEEAGILLALASDRKFLDFSDPGVEHRYRCYRNDLNQGKTSISDLARQEGLRLATDRIHYWAHWITPEGQPRRYDTRFFLAIAPQSQSAAHDGWELTDSAWVTPQIALDKARKREWTVIFPTIRNLMLLSNFSTAAEAEAAARSKCDVPLVQPRMVWEEGRIRFLVPGDLGYEEAGTTTSPSVAESPDHSPEVMPKRGISS